MSNEANNIYSVMIEVHGYRDCAIYAASKEEAEAKAVEIAKRGIDRELFPDGSHSIDVYSEMSITKTLKQLCHEIYHNTCLYTVVSPTREAEKCTNRCEVYTIDLGVVHATVRFYGTHMITFHMDYNEPGHSRVIEEMEIKMDDLNPLFDAINNAIDIEASESVSHLEHILWKANVNSTVEGIKRLRTVLKDNHINGVELQFGDFILRSNTTDEAIEQWLSTHDLDKLRFTHYMTAWYIYFDITPEGVEVGDYQIGNNDDYAGM